MTNPDSDVDAQWEADNVKRKVEEQRRALAAMNGPCYYQHEGGLWVPQRASITNETMNDLVRIGTVAIDGHGIARLNGMPDTGGE